MTDTGLRQRRLALSRDETSFLDSCAPDGPFGTLRLERLRFGPPEVWMAWKSGIGLVKLKLKTSPQTRVRAPTQALSGVAALLAQGDDWQVWEWVPGQPLLNAAPLLKPDYVMAQIQQIIAQLHSMGLAHGDLTPSNVVCRPDTTLCIIDWGDENLGTPGWVPDTPHSLPERDRFALSKLEEFLRVKGQCVDF